MILHQLQKPCAGSSEYHKVFIRNEHNQPPLYNPVIKKEVPFKLILTQWSSWYLLSGSHIHWQMRKPEQGCCKIVVQSKNWLKIKFFVDFDTIASLSSVSSFTDRQVHVLVHVTILLLILKEFPLNVNTINNHYVVSVILPH